MSVQNFAKKGEGNPFRFGFPPANLHLAYPLIRILSPTDPFAVDDDALDDAVSIDKSTKEFSSASAKTAQGDAIHIRIQQRNGRKTLTTIQGLPKDFDPKKVLKAAKKEFACNGSVVEDEEYGSVIQLQGDQRNNIKT